MLERRNYNNKPLTKILSNDCIHIPAMWFLKMDIALEISVVIQLRYSSQCGGPHFSLCESDKFHWLLERNAKKYELGSF